MLKGLYHLDGAVKKIWVSLLGSFFVFLFSISLFPKEKDCFLSSFPVPRKEKKEACPFPNLDLQNSQSLLLFPDIRAEISFFAVHFRPDNLEKQKKWTLLLNKTKEQKIVKTGEIVFLKAQLLEGIHSYSFSADETELGLKIEESGEKNILAQVIIPDSLRKYLTREKEREVFTISLQKESPSASELLKIPFFNEIAKAKWWGEDLIERFYQPEKSPKERLQIESGSKNYLCEFENAQFLIYKDGRWQPASSLNVSTRTFPLIYAQSINHKELKIDGWDSEGRYFSLSLFPAAAIPLKVRLEDILVQPRLKTLKKISCQFEKDLLQLKAGDLVIRKGGKWQLLSDEEKVRLHDEFSDSEIFVFDGISRVLGRKVIHGRLFNGMRTISEVIEVPMHIKRTKPTPGDAPPQEPISKANPRKSAAYNKKQIQLPNRERGKST